MMMGTQTSAGWSEGDENLTTFPFSLNPGYQAPQTNSPATPLGFFRLFFTDDLIDSLVKATNMYGDRTRRRNQIKKKSIWASWKHVSREEFEAFTGVILNMGLNEKSRLQDYFSTNWLDSQPFFRDVFSRERFLQIFWNLDLDSPKRDQPIAVVYSGIRKMRNFISYLEQRFQEFYTPTRELSLDESTVGFKGKKVKFKTYNRNKPTKWGLKIYTLSDSRNGYAYSFEPYFGKRSKSNLIRPDLPATCRIVVHLVSKYLNSPGGATGAHIFTDRYYTSIQLARELYNMQIHLTGTVKTSSKGIPLECRPIRTKKMKMGEMISLRNNNICVVIWKERKNKLPVCTLSTYYGNKMETKVIRYPATEKRPEREVSRPSVIVGYNKHMGGVDITDQYATSYAFVRKTSKWWRKMFFWFLDVAVNNAFLLYRMSVGGQKSRSVLFRKALIKELVDDLRNNSFRSLRREGSDGTLERKRLDGGFHAIYSKSGNRDCRVCSDRKSGKRKTTNFFCKSCPGRPALHPGECFENFHTKKRFKKN